MFDLQMLVTSKICNHLFTIILGTVYIVVAYNIVGIV